MRDQLAQAGALGALGQVRRLERELVPPRLDVRDADRRREPAEHRRVVERVADVDVRRRDRCRRRRAPGARRVMHADSLSKCGGPKLTCTLERTAVNPALRSMCDARPRRRRCDSETSSFQSIARSTSRYFESLDSRAPGTFDITSTAASFMRRRHSGRLAAGTPYCLMQLATLAHERDAAVLGDAREHRRHLHERLPNPRAGRSP